MASSMKTEADSVGLAQDLPDISSFDSCLVLREASADIHLAMLRRHGTWHDSELACLMECR